MAVITLAGVGYGEIVDTSHNPALRVFNIGIVLFGVAITVYVFSVVAAFLVEVEFTNPFWRRRMQKHIDELTGHHIVCGLGDTGRHVVAELQKTDTPSRGRGYFRGKHQEDAGAASRNSAAKCSTSSAMPPKKIFWRKPA